jgi:phage shock protein A
MSDNNDFDSKFSQDYSSGGVPKDDTDLRGMEYPQAAEYVMSFVATLKQTQKLIAEVEKDRALWKQRVDLAVTQGKTDLIAPAQKKLDEVDVKIAKLRAEEVDLAGKCSTLVENLKKLKATGVTRTIDTDRLLADFEMIIGDKAKEEHTLKKQFKDEEANAELAKLKAKMEGEKKE